jgi:hypothetical protein
MIELAALSEAQKRAYVLADNKLASKRRDDRTESMLKMARELARRGQRL